LVILGAVGGGILLPLQNLGSSAQALIGDMRNEMANHHITIWHTLIAAFAFTTAFGDLRWKKIPRTFTVAALAAGLLFHLIYGGFASAVFAAILGLAIGLVFFRIGAIGGGDVKLMAALGGLLGLQAWLLAMEAAVIVAALIAIAQALRQGCVRETLSNLGELVRWLAHKGATAHPAIHVGNAAMLRAPFGVAAAVGTLVAVIKQ
jgi:prepilin peptidase CpaA